MNATDDARDYATDDAPLWKGYDFVQAKPGEIDTLDCCVCGSRMDVKRNAFGPTNAFEGMAHVGHYRDNFTCPHASTVWHHHAVDLLREADELASEKLRGLVQQEVREWVAAHLPGPK